ncbi:MAG: hypothetical protein ACRD07_22095 [Acidimicrobiales bacterium]
MCPTPRPADGDRAGSHARTAPRPARSLPGKAAVDLARTRQPVLTILRSNGRLQLSTIKAVQETLGHANASETLDTDPHLWPADDDRIPNAVQSLHGQVRALRSAGV